MRLIHKSETASGKTVKVYRNAEWQEWIVRWFNHRGQHMSASDYHTDCKQDALDTARVSVELENAEYGYDALA